MKRSCNQLCDSTETLPHGFTASKGNWWVTGDYFNSVISILYAYFYTHKIFENFLYRDLALDFNQWCFSLKRYNSTTFPRYLCNHLCLELHISKMKNFCNKSVEHGTELFVAPLTWCRFV